MITPEFALQMPKVELHVHLEGSVRPETVLKLAKRNGVQLPADTVEGLGEWYKFRDFPHFVQVYVAITKCVLSADDLELITREFLEGQADQNVLHSEVTYTASTLEKHCGIPWADQRAALERAIAYGRDELGVSMGLILDIVRGDAPERGLMVAEWALESPLVVALGLAGEERLGTVQYAEAFKFAHDHDLPVIPHAGETLGAESIEEVLEYCQPLRIGHGVRCLESPSLVEKLRVQQIPLEVCPTSNVCLGVFGSLAEHALPTLMDEGLYVTINSDDPPMFNTTISQEFERCANEFDFSNDIVYSLTMNAARASLLPADKKAEMIATIREEFNSLTGD